MVIVVGGTSTVIAVHLADLTCPYSLQGFQESAGSGGQHNT